MIKHVLLASAIGALGITAVLAQNDPIAARKALMKDNGAQSRIASEMISGKQPFDLAKAKNVLTTFATVSEKSKSLYPESSKAGDTAALPAVWENKADFEAKLAKLAADAKAAEGKVTDLDSFKAVMGDVGKDCGGCHRTYRKRT
jgi:cytochrome c556